MKRTVIVLALLLGMVFIGATVYLYEQRESAVPSGQFGPVTFPTATSSQSGAGEVVPGQPIAVATLDGNVLTVRDFVNNGTTYRDQQNTNQYYLAGSPGYCLEDGSCPGGAPSDSYLIIYDGQTRSFVVSLIEEPIGEARRLAERFLVQTLGIPQSQLCELAIFVSTTEGVNSTYAGQSLGITSCPGAIQLPI